MSGTSGRPHPAQHIDPNALHRPARQVVIFPEGTRSGDGEVAPLKAGFAALAKRSGVPLVPVGIEGAFAAWPRANQASVRALRAP